MASLMLIRSKCQWLTNCFGLGILGQESVSFPPSFSVELEMAQLYHPINLWPINRGDHLQTIGYSS